MTSGGSRPRSGPPQDPNSRTSERRRQAAKKAAATPPAGAPATKAEALPVTSAEFNPLALPARGRTARAPAYPLPKILTGSKASADKFRARELEHWRLLWKLPQACAWEREPWRWPTIALYCRIVTTTEDAPGASAALLSRQRELRIECGLSPDGLKINGWAIAPDQLAEKRATKKAAAPAKKAAPVRRLRG